MKSILIAQHQDSWHSPASVLAPSISVDPWVWVVVLQGPFCGSALANGGSWAKHIEGSLKRTPPRGIRRYGGHNPLGSSCPVQACSRLRVCVPFNQAAFQRPQQAHKSAEEERDKAIPITKEAEAFQTSIHCCIFPNLLLERPLTSPAPHCDPPAKKRRLLIVCALQSSSF